MNSENSVSNTENVNDMDISDDENFSDDTDKDPDWKNDEGNDSSVSDDEIVLPRKQIVKPTSVSRETSSEHSHQDSLNYLSEVLAQTYGGNTLFLESIVSQCHPNFLKENTFEACFIKKVETPTDIKRVYDKRNACLFCKKSVAKIARHYLQIHSKENEVNKILELDVGCNERKKSLELLRHAGNFVHNIYIMTNNKGEIYVVKRPKCNKSSDYCQPLSFIPCVYCLGFYHKTLARVHMRNCKFNKENSRSAAFTKRSYNILFSTFGFATNSELFTHLLFKMRKDDLLDVIKKDPLICHFGTTMLIRKGIGQRKNISNKLRELGRLVVECNNLSKKDELLAAYMKPCYFDTVVKAALNLSKSVKCSRKPLTLGIKIGHALHQCCDLLKTLAIKKNELSSIPDIDNFNFLLAKEWSNKISVPNTRKLQDERVRKIPQLPETEDLVKLSNYLKEIIVTYADELKLSNCKNMWINLAKALMASIILFNKKREGEVGKMLLDDFLNNPDWRAITTQEISDSLSKTKIFLSKQFNMMKIPGKRGRYVPVLLTPKVESGLKLLCEKRDSVGILKSNIYLFANSVDGHLRGGDALNFFVSKCNLKFPNKIKSTALRKYVGTISQIMNLSKNELEFLANHMGHDINIHNKYYRLHESTIEMARVSKLLMAIDEGNLHKFKDQSMEEINLKNLLEKDFKCPSPKNPENETHSANNEMEVDLPIDQLEKEGESLNEDKMAIENKDGNEPHTKNMVAETISTTSKFQLRTKWDLKVKEKAKEFFKDYISNKKAPGKLLCEKFILETNVKNRAWKDVKTLINNMGRK